MSPQPCITTSRKSGSSSAFIYLGSTYDRWIHHGEIVDDEPNAQAHHAEPNVQAHHVEPNAQTPQFACLEEDRLEIVEFLTCAKDHGGG